MNIKKTEIKNISAHVHALMEILGLGLTILANCAKFYDTWNRYKASDIKLDKDSIHSWKGCSIAAAADAALSARSRSISIPLPIVMPPGSSI